MPPPPPGANHNAAAAALATAAADAAARRRYDAAPLYLQRSLLHGLSAQVAAGRRAPLRERIQLADAWRAEGNEAFVSGDDAAAVDAYERALSLFAYIAPLCEGSTAWRAAGIRDDELQFRHVSSGWAAVESEVGADAALHATAQRLLTSLLANLAVPALRTKQWALARAAAEDALRVDPANAKALYRRARALAEDPSSDSRHLAEARSDLLAAKALVESGDTQHAAGAAEIDKLLADITRQARRVEATLGSAMSKSSAKYVAARSGGHDASTKHAAARAELEDLDAGWAALHEGDHLLKAHADAPAVAAAAAAHAQASTSGRSQAATPTSHLASVFDSLDFSSPSFVDALGEDVRRAAEEQGIDLHDPLVREELQRIQLLRRSAPVQEQSLNEEGGSRSGLRQRRGRGGVGASSSAGDAVSAATEHDDEADVDEDEPSLVDVSGALHAARVRSGAAAGESGEGWVEEEAALAGDEAVDSTAALRRLLRDIDGMPAADLKCVIAVLRGGPGEASDGDGGASSADDDIHVDAVRARVRAEVQAMLHSMEAAAAQHTRLVRKLKLISVCIVALLVILRVAYEFWFV